jgi:hypothetical protein
MLCGAYQSFFLLSILAFYLHSCSPEASRPVHELDEGHQRLFGGKKNRNKSSFMDFVIIDNVLI